MQIFARPIRENQETQDKADTATDGNSVEARMCNAQYIMYTVAWYRDQIKG